MEILKILFLFLVFWQAPIVAVRAANRAPVYWPSFVLLALGTTGFVYLQFLT